MARQIKYSEPKDYFPKEVRAKYWGGTEKTKTTSRSKPKKQKGV